MQKKICFVSLGCDKNKVDLEHMINAFLDANFKIVNEDDAEIAVINTCAFLLESRKEAIDNILQMANRKKQKLEKLIVTGCLPNYEEIEKLKELLPEVDLFVQIKNQPNIVNLVEKLYNEKESKNNYKLGKRFLTTIGSHAYIKICDGCSNGCSYCTIPRIRGKFYSRKFEDIIDEAKSLSENGISEIILIGQDITKYGKDLYYKQRLTELIQEIAKLDNIKWIRLLYCYPDGITDELINEFKTNTKLCKYIDIPLQHITDKILSSMRRKSTKADIESIIIKLRTACPEIAIRTTFIVGYPGETKKDFKELCQFIKQYKLSNVGAFAYSREEGTIAAKLPCQVSDLIKRFRRRKIYKIQERIVDAIQNASIGKVYDCVCTNKLSPVHYSFRNEFNAPEIDYEIISECSDKEPIIGNYYKLRIMDTLNKYLIGDVLNELTK